MVAERMLVSELGLKSYKHSVFVPGVGKNVKRPHIAFFAQENPSGNVYQRPCYITYGLFLYSIRFLHIYFYA